MGVDLACPLADEQRVQDGRPEDGRRSSIEWLIDNAEAYASVVRAIRNARRSVWITQLAFDLDCVAYGVDGEDVLVADVLLEAARAHALDVRILLNESLLVDTAAAWRTRVDAEGLEHQVEVRGISQFPQLLHAKMMIVDDELGFLLGSPFVNGYWDDSVHAPLDPRRPMRELGGRPLHDVSLSVSGTPARQLAARFDEWWREVATGAAPASDERHASPDVATGQSILVAITDPARLVAERPEGATDILHELERGIAGARDLLYVEHQYLSSRRIVAAIADALARAPELCVVVLLNQNPDVTAYRGWQNQRLDYSGLLHHPRVGLFSPWTARRGDDGRWLVSQVFVHSKVVIGDDRWAVVGSANLDGVSLHSYGADFASRLGERIFRHVRNFDIALSLTADSPEAAASITALRARLRCEHLGEPGSTTTGPAELGSWRETAARNLGVLGTPPASDALMRIMVLPYDLAPSPWAQLASLGLSSDTVSLCFQPSWLEVHCSPNWIRNMFA